MGRGETAGTIDSGKVADLLIVNGDPLVDISCLGDHDNLKGILMSGAWMKNNLDAGHAS